MSQPLSYHDIQLSEAEIAQQSKYKNSFGQDWVDRAIEYSKAIKYLELYFDINRESIRAGNCYYKGTFTYTRKDGGQISTADFEALQIMDHGQCNKRSISEDNMSMIHYWECDSRRLIPNKNNPDNILWHTEQSSAHSLMQ